MRKEALETATKINYLKGLSHAHYYLGNIFHQKEQWTQALTCYFASVEMGKEEKDRKYLGDLHHEIGVVLSKQDKDSLALRHLEYARSHCQASENFTGMTSTLNAMGEIYLKQGKRR